jgi:CRISPR system Cascade subunit CasA
MAIYDLSPLVVVGIHRLLTAILQDALNPQENDDLEQLWRRGSFTADAIERFGAQYADRFELFSEDKPFLQSADLPLFPKTKEECKDKTTVARLFPETPSGGLLTHYRHMTEDEQVFSPATVAAGLVAIPPFISSGGAGLMPSINGVPPIYVLPGGRTLFESLTASLISAQMLADDYPTKQGDLAWWKRPVPVQVEQSKKKTSQMSLRESKQLSQVGYLHGLTFPARKVRLHPEYLNAVCSRSGQFSEWCVRTMTFRMGESVLEDAPLWRDSFVAYKEPPRPKGASTKRKPVAAKKKGDKPNPLRPIRGKATWREFTGLFLQHKAEAQQTLRPRFLDQLCALTIGEKFETYPFRCLALQTDGKMKFFEWMDFGFDVPPSLLQDPQGAEWTEQALSFAADCAFTITRVFSAAFGRKAKNAERFKRLKERLEADYWSALAGRFRQFVLELGDRATRQQRLDEWLDTTVREAQAAFERAADATGDD